MGQNEIIFETLNKEISFEEAIARLEQVVELLEKGQVTLEEAMKLFQEGMGLVGFCTAKLAEAEKTIEFLLDQQE